MERGTKVENTGFEVEKGNFVRFDGVMCDGKELAKITVDRDKGTASAEYSDGAKYTVNAVVSETNGIITLTDISDKWEAT